MLGTKYFCALLRAATGLNDYLTQNPPDYLFKSSKEAQLSGFIRAHVMEHGKLPAETTIAEELGYKLPADVDEPSGYYLSKLNEAHVHHELKRSLLATQDELNRADSDPLRALELLRGDVLNLHTQSSGQRIVNYAKDGADIIESEYSAKKALKDDHGLMLGWPSFDNMAGGLSAGDVVSIVGRPAMGKSWLLLYTALASWKKHQRVPLFVSMEMKPLHIIQRLAAMDTTLNLSDLKMAQVSDNKFKSVLKHLRENAKKPDYWIVDGAMMSTIDDIVANCRQFRPSALYLDGGYLVRTHTNTRASRWEKVAEVAERLKGDVAEALNIPVIVSYQFNRQAVKKKDDPGLEDIAFSDVIAQVSSVVLGLTQDESVETKKRRRVSILKGRNGESGEFFIRWEFKQYPMLDFCEVDVDDQSDFSYT